MKAVLDTSFLISLARIDWLELLHFPSWELLAPQAVYHEAVEEGVREGYPDATEIARLFAQDEIKVLSQMTGAADAEVLELAQREGALLCSDDRGLLRRAKHSGLATLDSPGFIFLLHRSGRLRTERYRTLLLSLRAAQRIDQTTLESYLRLGGER